MAAFEYVRADDVAVAVAMVSADPGASYLAGGTTLLDLLLKDGVVEATGWSTSAACRCAGSLAVRTGSALGR
jgi:hypothetical protein